jgi:hypothetical protein
MKIRQFELFGYKIDVYKFGKRQFMYPLFNGNAEYEVSKKGFKELKHYIRTMVWADQIMQETMPEFSNLKHFLPSFV